MHDETPNETGSAEGSRVVRLASGMRWRATVVARLISEDAAAAGARARLVLRLECLSLKKRALRVAVTGARSLDAVSDEALIELIERPAARRSSGAHRMGKPR
jgi:hypothetical protein